MAGISTLVLFAYTLLLRASTLVAARRRRAVVRRWRGIFAQALASRSAAETMRLPRRRRKDLIHLLDEWNRFRTSIQGESAQNLVVLAHRLALGEFAALLVRKLNLGRKLLGIRTLGRLGDRGHWDTFVELIVRERDEPEVLAAMLKALGNHGGIPGLGDLARHETWYVRMQAARLLGRVGRERDLPMLERLLSDTEWWVRYRAAQAIVALPFLGPKALRAVAQRQHDPYAADMMHHAMAEAGL